MLWCPGQVEAEPLNPDQHTALLIEFRKRSIPHDAQVSVPISYDEETIGEHRLDLLVEREIVVELKAVKNLDDSRFAVVKGCFMAAKRKHGLLLHFATPTLQIKRVIAP